MNKVKEIIDTEYINEELEREENEIFSLPSPLRTLIFFFLGLGFACFKGPGDISPFAVSLLSALPYSCCLPFFIGSISGYLVSAHKGEAIRYTAAILSVALFRFIMNKRFKEKSATAVSSIISFSALFVSGLIHMWFDEVYLLALLVLLFEGLSALLSTLVFTKSFSLPFYKGSLEALSKKDVFILVLSLCISLMCLCSINLQGLSPGRIFACVAMMFVCFYKGSGAGAVTGALIGAFLSLTPSCESLFPAFVIAGLAGGFLSQSGQIIPCLAFTFSYILALGLSGSVSEGLMLFMEPVIGCGIFLLIPAEKISLLEDYFDRILTSRKVTEAFELAETLMTASENIKGVAAIVEDVSGRLDKIINPEVNRLFTRIQQRVCNNCEKRADCWSKHFDSTASEILGIIGVEKESQGKISLSVTCKQYDLLCSTLTCFYPSYSNAIATKNKISELRRILTDQFFSMSDFLGELSLNISQSRTKDKGKSAYLKTALSDNGISVEELSCFFYMGRISVEITVQYYDKEYIRKITAILELIAKRHFEEPEARTVGSFVLLVFKEKAAFIVKSGYSQRSMRSGRLCGDSVAIFSSDCGLLNFLISDGMGTGSRAAIDSNLTCGIIERLLSSSFSFKGACKTVNNALIMKSTDESTATVDALQINPYNCRGTFYKAGGAISLMRRGDKVRVIEKASLPLGIIRDVPLATEKTDFQKGDIILLLSDGVTNKDCGWINDELLAWSKSDMQALAFHIASLAALRSESDTRDDITVLALKIEKAE